MSRLFCLWLAGAAIGCVDAEVATTEASPLRPGAIANRTALVSLTIVDGKARFDDVRCRPIDFLERRPEAHGGRSDHYLEVTKPGGTRPIEVPVSLGAKDERPAEATSAFAAGGAILRAPCFGRGTQIALKDAVTQATLARIEVVE